MNKKIIKTLSIATISAVSLAPLVSCRETSSTNNEYHIMEISDIRGEIPGYGDEEFKDTRSSHPGAIRTVDAMQEIAQKSKDYVILSGGDQNSSGKFSACTQGDTMYPVLKAMGVRYSAVGNHAWDWGREKLENPKLHNSYDHLGRTEKTEGSYFIAANILTDSSKQDYKWVTDKTKTEFIRDFNEWNINRVSWADPYKVVDLGGHKICLIGLTTRDTIYDGNQQYIKEGNFSFVDYNASVVYTKHLFEQEEPELFNQIESFILLTHCGAQESDSWISGESADLANNIETPIDAVMAAHTQKPVCGFIWNNKFNKRVAITEVPEKMRSFVDLKISFDDSKPVGQRFKMIEPRIVTPHIDKSSFAAATAEINNIVQNPRNEIVRRVCDIYEVEKTVALNRLQKQIGKTTNGLSYLQADGLKKYLYPEDVDLSGKHKNVLVEEAGAFAAKSLIAGFNKYYVDQKFSPEEYKKANISFISNDSISRGIDVKYLEEGVVTLNELYNLFPYDEHAVTASLTYYQLEQIVKYMFTGKNRTQEIMEYCTDEYLVTPEATPIKYKNLAFPFGPAQFYGFCFDFEDADKSDKQYRKYNYVGGDFSKGIKGTLKVYDPDLEGVEGGCKLDDPTTWKGEDYWQGKYITIVLNSFNFDYGNNQQRMIRDFAIYNESENPEPIKIKRFYSVDVRDLSELYIKSTAGLDIGMDMSICKLLAHRVGE